MKKNKVVLMDRSEHIFNIIMNILGVIITLISLYPIYYVLISSVSKPFFVDNGTVLFAPINFNFESYRQAFSKNGLWMSYANTFFYTIFGVLTNMVFTTTFAYALSKKKLVFRTGFTLMAVFTMWFNAGIIPFFLNAKNLGLLNTRSVILFAFAINTYNMIIMKSFFEQIPSSLEEAAYIDGANNITIFSKIYLPLSKPAIATVSLLYGVTRWNGYFWAMNLLSDDNKLPLQVFLKKLIVDRAVGGEDAAILTQNSLWSQTTVVYAIIIIAIVPMLLIYPFIQKYFKGGLTLGANKG